MQGASLPLSALQTLCGRGHVTASLGLSFPVCKMMEGGSDSPPGVKFQKPVGPPIPSWVWTPRNGKQVLKQNRAPVFIAALLTVPTAQAARRPVSGGRGQDGVVCPHRGLLPSQKGRRSDSRCSAGESWKCYAEGKKADTKDQIMHDSIYMKHSGEARSTRGRQGPRAGLGAARGRGGGTGAGPLRGGGVSLWGDEKGLGLDRDDVCTTT